MGSLHAALWRSFFDELEKIAGVQGPQVAQNMLRRVSRAGPPQGVAAQAMIPPALSPPAPVGIARVESTLGSTGKSTLVPTSPAPPLPMQPQAETYTMNQLGAGGPPGLSVSGPRNV